MFIVLDAAPARAAGRLLDAPLAAAVKVQAKIATIAKVATRDQGRGRFLMVSLPNSFERVQLIRTSRIPWSGSFQGREAKSHARPG
jgi:hypothetical protein